jgi:hypothetical protein
MNLSNLVILFVITLLTISTATATALPTCSLTGLSLFLPAAVEYDDLFSPLCPSRGQCINAPDKTKMLAIPSSNSQSNPFTFTVDTCMPDGRMLLMTNAGSASSSGIQQPSPLYGDLYDVNVEGSVVAEGKNVAQSRWSSSPDYSLACYGDAGYYTNISTMRGVGALDETTAQRTTSIRIDVFSSTAACVPRSYYIKIVNPSCMKYGFFPARPACSFTEMSVNAVVGSPTFPLPSSTDLLSYPSGTLPTGGNPIIAQLPTNVNTNQIYLSFRNEILLNHESMARITHYTWNSNTNAWVPSGFTRSFVLHALLAESRILVRWSPTAKNRYVYDISSSLANNECSVLNRELIFTNDLGDGGGGFGDPQFVGLRGQSFQIHGYDGAIFNIITNKHFQFNALFTFLTGPRPCPVLPSGRKSAACWSHDGSYLGDLGMKTNSGDEIVIHPGTAANGFKDVTFNNRSLVIGETVEFTYKNEDLFGSSTSTIAKKDSVANNVLSKIPGLNQGKIQQISTHELSIEVSCFKMEIENVDGFVNIRRLSVPAEYQNALRLLRTHGLLGQTWQLKEYKGSVKEIEGEVDDYVVEDGLFGNDFLFNQYAQL